MRNTKKRILAEAHQAQLEAERIAREVRDAQYRGRD